MTYFSTPWGNEQKKQNTHILLTRASYACVRIRLWLITLSQLTHFTIQPTDQGTFFEQERSGEIFLNRCHWAVDAGLVFGR